MEISFEEAKSEYFEILNTHVREMLKDSIGFKQLMGSELALGRFLPSVCVGMKGFPPLDLVVREDFSNTRKNYQPTFVRTKREGVPASTGVHLSVVALTVAIGVGRSC